MKVSQIVDWLNGIAPFDTAEGFDNVGLLLGDPDVQVRTVLFGLDLTEEMAREAERLGAELIVTHHPFIFHAIKRIDYTSPQGRILRLLMQRRVNVIAAHTNWDQAVGGVSDTLAATLGLLHITSVDPYIRIGSLPAPLSAESMAEQIRDALHASPRCYPASDRPISRVAVAGGAYGEGYEAALAAGADAYVVGEIAHHEILDAHARGLIVYDAGHSPTELPGATALYERFLTDALAASWPVQAHLHTQAPFPGALPALP